MSVFFRFFTVSFGCFILIARWCTFGCVYFDNDNSRDRREKYKGTKWKRSKTQFRTRFLLSLDSTYVITTVLRVALLSQLGKYMRHCVQVLSASVCGVAYDCRIAPQLETRQCARCDGVGWIFLSCFPLYARMIQHSYCWLTSPLSANSTIHFERQIIWHERFFLENRLHFKMEYIPATDKIQYYHRKICIK